MNTSDKSAERHLIVTLRSKPEHRSQVKELLLKLVDPVRSEPGCLYYNLFQQAEDPDAFMLAAGWANDAAVAAHPIDTSLPQIVERITTLLASPMELLHTLRVSENPG